jgi:predicted DNA-binding transcriptional regulator AlpA
VPVNTLYQWRTKGYGPTGRRIGKHVRYRPEDVDSWVAEQGSA